MSHQKKKDQGVQWQIPNFYVTRNSIYQRTEKLSPSRMKILRDSAHNSMSPEVDSRRMKMNVSHAKKYLSFAGDISRMTADYNRMARRMGASSDRSKRQVNLGHSRKKRETNSRPQNRSAKPTGGMQFQFATIRKAKTSNVRPSPSYNTSPESSALSNHNGLCPTYHLSYHSGPCPTHHIFPPVTYQVPAPIYAYLRMTNPRSLVRTMIQKTDSTS